MLIALILMVSLSTQINDPVSASLESYRKISSYRVTLRSRSSESREVMRFFFKKPGFVRMEFIEPYKDAVLVYDPEKREAKVRPFGFLKPFVLRLSPENSLIRSSRGHRVDESDIGALMNTVRKLQENGKATLIGEEDLNGKKTTKVEVKGNGDFMVDNDVHRYQVWLDQTNHLPLKVSAYGLDGGLIEEVVMDDLEVNVSFREDFFSL